MTKNTKTDPINIQNTKTTKKQFFTGTQIRATEHHLPYGINAALPATRHGGKLDNLKVRQSKLLKFFLIFFLQTLAQSAHFLSTRVRVSKNAAVHNFGLSNLGL